MENMHRIVAKRFLEFSGAYFLFALVLSVLLHPQGMSFAFTMISISRSHWINLLTYMPLISLAVAAALFWIRRSIDTDRAKAAGSTFFACVFFMWGFGLCKSLMPHIMPVWADPMMIDLDRALHGGIDPWRLIEGLRGIIPVTLVDYLYLKFWAWPALAGPVLLMLFDANAERVARFFALFAFTWICLGNLLALLLLSVGPVFYDRAYGADVFGELGIILQNEAQTGSLMSHLRDWLWRVNLEGHEGATSGISAFPSVHVAIAAVMFFYLSERNWILAAVGLSYLVFVLMASVLSGLHYAVDGYASILLIGLAWVALRRWSPIQLVKRDATSHPQLI